MKKIINSLIISFGVMLASPLALAAPITHTVDFVCPAASSLANFGNYIAGFGSEILSRSTTNIIYFQSRDGIQDVPSSFVNYSNAATSYDGPSGSVMCKYLSTNASERSFDISYTITNGKGGRIITQTNNTIRVLFLVGFKN